MTLVFGILAHEPTPHLSALLAALGGTGGHILVHVDAKCDLAPFLEIAHDDSVDFVRDRSRVNWGGFSMVTATMNLIRRALDDGSSRFVLLSGSDYPLAEPAVVGSLLSQTRYEHINLVRQPAPEVNKPMSRLSRYYFEYDRTAPAWRTVTPRVINMFGLPRRYQSMLGGLCPYAGSQWWAVSAGVLREFVYAFDSNPSLVELYRRSRIPDEGFFQTVVGNSPFADLVRRNLTFTDWSRPKGPKPAEIDNEHIDYLARSKGLVVDSGYGAGTVLFARKFPSESVDLVASVQRRVWGKPDLTWSY